MATKKRTATKQTGGKGALALGALAAAAAAGAAGYYFYASKDASKHRRIAAKWASDMKKDVVREAKKLKNVDRAKLASIVDEAAAAYRSAKSIDREELGRAARELKANWHLIASELGGAKAVKKRVVKKAAKKTARRA